MLDGWNLDKGFQRRCALDALKGMGEASLGQWEEWTGRFYHIRRRLSAEEQARVGDARDIRGTPEAATRRAAVERFLPLHMRSWQE